MNVFYFFSKVFPTSAMEYFALPVSCMQQIMIMEPSFL